MPKGYFIPFTPEQEQFIKDNYLKLNGKQLQTKLGCGWKRVQRFLDKHGLVIPKELVEQRRKSGQIKKGNVPINKGKKMEEYLSAEAIAKIKKTQFRKGHLPHNTLADGVVSVRPEASGREYKYIRLSKGNWELYHRVVWERVNGPIPEGLIVSFKDGDSMNVSLSNLKLIDRCENMYRNSHVNYPEEVIPSS